MDVTLEKDDVAIVMAALILALEAKPRGQTAKDRDNIRRIARDIARQVEERA